ncbi:MAG: hypothetical protein JWN88_2551 [Frankiales bacterium]|nr:hypothetical protein [Frankiales bacterium]
MTRLRPTALLVAVLTAAVLSGCGASRDAQTYQRRIQGSSTDTGVGDLRVRNVSVVPPEEEGTYPAGSDAEVKITVASNTREPDRLVSVSSPDAEKVVVLVGGRPGELEVPPLGLTGNDVRLRLEGLRAPLRTGEYVRLSLRFEDNGTAEILVPVELTGKPDRPIYTAEEGDDHEPALQAPTGGHGEGGH